MGGNNIVVADNCSPLFANTYYRERDMENGAQALPLFWSTRRIHLVNTNRIWAGREPFKRFLKVKAGELACFAPLQGDPRFGSMGVAGILGIGRSRKQGTDTAPYIEKPGSQRNPLWTLTQRDDGIRYSQSWHRRYSEGRLRSWNVTGDLTVHEFPVVDVRHRSTEIIPIPCG